MNHRHESFPAYAATRGVNWSTLRAMSVSPLAYQYRCTHPLEDTAQMRLGRIIHTAVLEPDALLHEVVTWEDGIRRGKVWDAFAEANSDKTIISGDEYETALAVRDAIRHHPVAGRLLRFGRSEVTLKWVDAETHLRCKARVDHLFGDLLTDLKTTRTVDARIFGRHASDLQYPQQMAFSRMGLVANGHEPAPIHIVAVEQTPPFDVGVFRVPEDVLEEATLQVQALLWQVRRYRGRKRPPGRYQGVQTLEVPPWFFSSDGDEELILMGLKERT